MKLKAVFLDKDGNLIPELPADNSYDLSDVNESFVEGLQLLQSHGYLLVIVSGKQGDRQEHDPRGREEFRKKIIQSCLNMGIYLDGFYYPPGTNESELQKLSEMETTLPEASLLQKAAGDMDIDLSKSWMIGDLLNDIEAGTLAGCNTVFVNNGKEVSAPQDKVKVLARDLADAARKIVTTSIKKGRNKSRKKAVVA